MLIAHYVMHLGFNPMPYTKFFLLSSPSRLALFHAYVVVLVSLGDSSNSGNVLS